METITKWIWQHADYPHFMYNLRELSPLLSHVSRNTGKLEYAIHALNHTHTHDFLIDASTNEIVQSSEIEGEILNRDSVRSSVRKKLDETFDRSEDRSTHHTDGLADVLIDSSSNHAPLTIERLHGWHSALFPTGYSGGYRIHVATFRSEEMRVVSNRGYREKIHYTAPPHERLPQEMAAFLRYVNHAQENPYIQSAIAHLWFVTIHPYDDGNGRIARSIAHYILSGALGLDHHGYSLSEAIRQERKAYYDTLERSQNLFYNRGFDFTEWIAWHIGITDRAIATALETIEIVIQKTKFWDHARMYPLNARQIKVLNKILDKGITHFEGRLSTKKYAAMTRTSIPTAKRDISQLLQYGLLHHIEGSAGRSTRYEIKI